MREGELLELVDGLYAAPLEVAGWERALDRLREVFGATWGHVVRVDPGSMHAPFRVLHGGDPAWAEAYEREWYLEDPWAGPSLALPVGTVCASEDVLPVAELRRTRFYREWLAPQGLESGMGALLERSPDGRVSALTFVRARGGPPYGEAELAQLRALVAPARRALQVEGRLRELAVRRVLSDELLARLGVASIVVERGGRIAWHNPTAAGLLATRTLVREEEGCLTAAPAAARALREAVEAATRRESPEGGLVQVPGADGAAASTLAVWPVPTDRPWHGTGHAVVVAKPEAGQRPLSEEVVASVYGLTAAEAAVAVALARGEEVRGIARVRRVSTETVRGQLKSVLAKTGCTRQADLVRMLLAGPAGWPDPRR